MGQKVLSGIRDDAGCMYYSDADEDYLLEEDKEEEEGVEAAEMAVEGEGGSQGNKAGGKEAEGEGEERRQEMRAKAPAGAGGCGGVLGSGGMLQAASQGGMPANCGRRPAASMQMLFGQRCC